MKVKEDIKKIRDEMGFKDDVYFNIKKTIKPVIVIDREGKSSIFNPKSYSYIKSAEAFISDINVEYILLKYKTIAYVLSYRRD